MNNKNELVNKLYTLRACLSYIAQKADLCREYNKKIDDNNDKIKSMEGKIRKSEIEIENSTKMLKNAEAEIKALKRNEKLFSGNLELLLGFFSFILSICLYFSNQYFVNNEVFTWWGKKFSGLVILLCFVMLGFGIYVFVRACINLRHSKQNDQSSIISKQNLIAELGRTIESTNKTINAQNAEYSVNKRVLEFNSSQQRKNINNETRLAQTVYNEIKNQMRGILDQSDWKHLDIIIYYLNTGRADNIKEALQLLDRHLQAESIKNEIRSASSNITSEIRSMKQDIKAAINDCASVISRQIQTSTEKTNNLIDDKMSGLIEVQENILTQRQLQNALIEKHNQTSQALVDECKNLRLGL